MFRVYQRRGIMIARVNKLSEIATKQGIKISKNYSIASARRVMLNANLPKHAIERVLYEPHKIRSTDLLD